MGIMVEDHAQMDKYTLLELGKSNIYLSDNTFHKLMSKLKRNEL